MTDAEIKIFNDRYEKYRHLIYGAAETYGIDPKLFSALLFKESKFNPKAVSSAGAGGIAQLMPETAKRFGVTDVYDPNQAIPGAAKYLAYLQSRIRANPDLYNGKDNEWLLLSGYNAGEGNLKKYKGNIPFTETISHHKKIKEIRDWLAQIEKQEAVKHNIATRIINEVPYSYGDTTKLVPEKRYYPKLKPLDELMKRLGIQNEL